MRSSILLLAAAGCAHANWMKWSVNHEQVWAPKETGHATETDDKGWTPLPTEAPGYGVRSEGEKVIDLLKRQTSEKEWVNSETCGWFSILSSSAMVCEDGFKCSTSNDIVACRSATFGRFYSACLDYTAYTLGSCSNIGFSTGCCSDASLPACGRYVWTGSPQRSMFKCFETASALTMLDVPRFVLDASRFSETHTTPTPTITASSTATDDPASSPDSTGGSGSGSKGGDPGSGSGSSSGGDSDSSDNSNSGGSNNYSISVSKPVVIGSAVGGGVLLLIIILFLLRRSAKKGKLGFSYTSNKYNHNMPKEGAPYPYYPPMPMPPPPYAPQYPQPQYPPPSWPAYR